jgi:hypothetical protein
MNTHLIGIGDYTRNSVYNSLFIIGILVPLNKIEYLRELGVDKYEENSEYDLEEMANKIIEHFDFEVEEIKAGDIAENRIDNLECISYLRCFNKLKRTIYDKVFAKNFTSSREEIIEKLKCLRCKYFREESWDIIENVVNSYLVCKSAVFLAKYYYDYYLNDLKIEYGKIGNGDVNDKQTINYLESMDRKIPRFVRINSNLFQSHFHYLTVGNN